MTDPGDGSGPDDARDPGGTTGVTGTPEPGGTTGTVTVRYFAGARAAAGVREELLPATSLRGVLSALEQRHGDRLARVLAVASFLVDGVARHDRDTPLPSGATLDVLPPFAGG